MPVVQCTVIFSFIWVYVSNSRHPTLILMCMMKFNVILLFQGETVVWCIFSLTQWKRWKGKREKDIEERGRESDLNNSTSSHESQYTFHTLSACKVGSPGKAHDYFITSVTHFSEIHKFVIYFPALDFEKLDFCNMLLYYDNNVVPSFFGLWCFKAR